MAAMTGTIHGRVQGVGFRVSTEWAARRIGVDGWVRNLRDGSVEVFAQGDPGRLEEFRQWLSEGPRAARVDAASIHAVPPDPTLTGFSIR